jgi:hypothetical protein
MVRPSSWVVDMRHYVDEDTGDLREVIPERVLSLAIFFWRDRGVGYGSLAGGRRTYERTVPAQSRLSSLSRRHHRATRLDLRLHHLAVLAVRG